MICKYMHRFILIPLTCVFVLGLMASQAWPAKSSQSLYPRLDKPALSAGAVAAEPEQEAAEAQDPAAVLFSQGYLHFNSERYQKACHDLFRFLSEKTPDDAEYEWAEFFFGLSLKKLGFNHAAMDTLTNVVTRKPNPKIVGYTLELMEEITRTMPFDRELIVHRGICDQSYDFVDDDIRDFVHYYQGEYDWEHGLFDWGDKHFAQIDKDSYYYNMYLFKKALRTLYENRIDDAITILVNIIKKTKDGTPLKDDARKTLARLYYEKGEFEKADFIYLQIEMNIVEQASNLLERAWAHYRMGNAERAMGLLYSFEAPSYIHSFTPEFYILKSFIYKDVCHYRAALNVLEQFKARYGSSLDGIYERRPPQDNKAMLLVILNKPNVKRIWRFLNLLDREYDLAQKNEDEALKAYLTKLYSLKKDEAETAFRILMRDEYEKMADDMLRFEEEAHLMEYEIGLDMYQRVYTYHYDEEDGQDGKAKKDKGPKPAVYAFQGEFWNDELDDYKVELPNKCQNAEEWDIFFK